MSGKFQRLVRHFVMTLCCIGLFALSGCASFSNGGMAPSGSVATTVSGVGHLGGKIGVPFFYVNGQWGGNSSGWGGGGGGICCATMPYRSGKATMVTVKWETVDTGKKEDRWHEATVPVHFDGPPGKSNGLNIHFLPGNKVEAWMSGRGILSADYPGPKYPRGPAPDYAPLADEM